MFSASHSLLRISELYIRRKAQDRFIARITLSSGWNRSLPLARMDPNETVGQTGGHYEHDEDPVLIKSRKLHGASLSAHEDRDGDRERDFDDGT